MKLPIKLAFGADASFQRNKGGMLPPAREEGYRIIWQSDHIRRGDIKLADGVATINYRKAGVTVLVADYLYGLFFLPSRAWRALANRLYYDRMAEQYERGVEDGRRQAYFNPELFDSDLDEEAATYFGLSVEEYDKKIKACSEDWHFQYQHRKLGRDLPLSFVSATND